jgi:hypothetical protein
VGALVGFFTLVLVINFCVWRTRLRRRQAAIVYLARFGFTADPHPEMHAAEIQHLEKRRGSRNRKVTLWGTLKWEGVPVTVAEIYDMVGSGKQRRRRIQTQVTVACPRQWPELEVAPQTRWWGAWGFPKSFRKAAPVGNLDFDAWWRLVAPDRRRALDFLRPPLRAWLANRRGQGWWCVRNGRASCTLERACDGPDIERLASNIVSFVAAASLQAVPV